MPTRSAAPGAVPADRAESTLVNFEFHEGRACRTTSSPSRSYAFALLVTFAVERRRIGSYLRAIREDQAAAQSVGVSVLRYKLGAAALSAALAALGGHLLRPVRPVHRRRLRLPARLSILIAFVPILGELARDRPAPRCGGSDPALELTRIAFGVTGQGSTSSSTAA